MYRIELSKDIKTLGLNPVPLYFESDVPIAQSSELLITATLAALMKNGVRTGYGVRKVDAGYLSNLPKIQELLQSWWADYQRVDLSELSATSLTAPEAKGVGCFFSGGVDSFYTLLKNQPEITHLIYVHGFDIPVENEKLFRQVEANIQSVTEHFDLRLVVVRTNLRELYELNNLEWGQGAFGSALASVAHLLSGYFKQVFMPASLDTNNLMPWGSHPDLDPLWGSSSLSLVHHGCVPRTEKIRFIADSPLALSNLRVCYLNPGNSYNCCRCEKCVRTMVALHALGVLDQCVTFPEPLTYRKISKLWITSEAARVFVRENIALLEQTKRDPQMVKILKQLLAQPQWLLNTHLYIKRRRNRVMSILNYWAKKLLAAIFNSWLGFNGGTEPMSKSEIAQKAKISIVAVNLSSNGTNRCVQIAKALQHDYNVEIVGSCWGEAIWPPLEGVNVKIRSVPGELFPKYLVSIHKILGYLDGDIIIACKPRLPSFGVALLKKVLTGKPVILDIDDDEIAQTMPGKRVSVLKKIRNPSGYLYTHWMLSFCKYADTVFSVSEYFRTQYGGVIVCHGQDPDFLNPDNYDPEVLRCDLHIKGKDFIIGFIGSPQAQKGVDLILEAIECTKLKHIKLMLVGADQTDPYIKKLMARYSNFLLLIKPQPIQKLPEYLAVSDLVILPQRDVMESKGQMPAKLTDAMAMGKPIIASSISDIPEYLNGRGIVVSPGSISELTESILWVINNPREAAKLGADCRKYFNSKLTLGSMAKNMQTQLEYLHLNRNKGD